MWTRSSSTSVCSSEMEEYGTPCRPKLLLLKSLRRPSHLEDVLDALQHDAALRAELLHVLRNAWEGTVMWFYHILTLLALLSLLFSEPHLEHEDVLGLVKDLEQGLALVLRAHAALAGSHGCDCIVKVLRKYVLRQYNQTFGGRGVPPCEPGPCFFTPQTGLRD